jgi:hypothetical protein
VRTTDLKFANATSLERFFAIQISSDCAYRFVPEESIGTTGLLDLSFR